MNDGQQLLRKQDVTIVSSQSWLQHQQTLTLTRRLSRRFNSRFAPELANNWNIAVSQGSAEMSLRCGGICNDHSVAYFVLSLVVKEFWKSIYISWSYQHECGVLFFWLTMYINVLNNTTDCICDRLTAPYRRAGKVWGIFCMASTTVRSSRTANSCSQLDETASSMWHKRMPEMNLL